MQELIRKKKYKARAPMETVGIIRDILKSRGVEINEELDSEKEIGVYSCRITAADEGLSGLGIGTNGKGMTEEYALASGYAEFMERLQNERLTGSGSIPRYGVSAVPAKKCSKEIRAFLKANYGEHEKAGKVVLSLFDSFNMAEFSTFDGSEKISVPIDLLLTIATSNGMCAGNNRTEAVIQGVSEIFERYAQMKIIFEKRSLPVIPEEYFKGHDIYDKLQQLKEKNIYYEIKDCSLGLGLPVVGLYLRREDGRELFHLGSDPSPVTALERTVTEIFQGAGTLEEIGFYEPVTEEQDEDFWKYQLELSSWGLNVYPRELAGDSGGRSFEGFDHPESVSDEDDLKYYLGIIEALGRKLYIRDVSFLGFPSYYCYIPGLNFVRFFTGIGEELGEYLTMREEIRRLVTKPALRKGGRKKLAQLLVSYSEEFGYLWPDESEKLFFPRGLFPQNFTLPGCIKAMLFASCGMKARAAEEMENYILCAGLDEETEEELTDFVMYMRTGEYELSSTPDMCRRSLGDTVGCRNCGSCCARPFCCREAADRVFGNIFP